MNVQSMPQAPGSWKIQLFKHMSVIKIAIGVLFFLPGISTAATDPACLKHLGGALAGVQCFVGLSDDLNASNKDLLAKILVTIPKGNKNRNALQSYALEQKKAKKYCELSRASSTQWRIEKRAAQPMYYQPDVIYFQCVYDNLERENRFLNDLLKNALQE